MIVDGDLVANSRRFLELMPSWVRSLILLSDGLSPVPDTQRAHVLTKPFEGGDLLRLVRKLPRIPCPSQARAS
jgi:hypothetical protein